MKVYKITAYREDPGGFRGWDTFILILPDNRGPLKALKDELDKTNESQWYNLNSAKVNEITGTCTRVSHASW